MSRQTVLQTINDRPHYCLSDEFPLQPHEVYTNLRIIANLGLLERIVGLLRELSASLNIGSLYHHHATHGAFVSTECVTNFSRVFITAKADHLEPILKNVDHHLNVSMVSPFLSDETCIIFNEDGDDIIDVWRTRHVILSTTPISSAYHLSNTPYYLSIPESYREKFAEAFKWWFSRAGSPSENWLPTDNLANETPPELTYDNCLNVCFMVKNAGPGFEAILKENLPYMDQWTILDTGSTDDTIEIVKRVLGENRKGRLFQEPFINFPESRNRCLELAGQACKFTVMLDDTYCLRGGLREFLNLIRGDQFATSYNLFILSEDVQYASNRLIKSAKRLRYTGLIHEIISPVNNVNVTIPLNEGQIFDVQSDYMHQRSVERKTYDLAILGKMLQEDPQDSRALYYLAQTHNILENWSTAYELFLQRAAITDRGFSQEVADSWFEAGRCAEYHLGYPWETCLAHYEHAYDAEPERPESQYFIGAHYYQTGELMKALFHFTKAYQIGYPIHREFSLKPTLSFYYLPRVLAEVCYTAGQRDLATNWIGLSACNTFFTYLASGAIIKEPNLQHNIYQMTQWRSIYHNLCQVRAKEPAKQVCCFVADGGFEPWTGRDILNKGMGGSETWVIEMARWIQRLGNYQVFVFCNCLVEDTFEGVTYVPLAQYGEFIYTHHVDTVIISRFTEYIPCTIAGNVDHIHVIFHDVLQPGQIIPMHPKIKQFYCLSEWHLEQFLSIFPQFRDRASVLYYGLTTHESASLNQKYTSAKDNTIIGPLCDQGVKKRPFSFIYSSFPNRGLLPLLQMWPKIREKNPEASLNVYCNLDHWWSNKNFPELMAEIRRLLSELVDQKQGVVNHGWVDKQTLMEGWATADIWFYPSTFCETFCLTALECARSKTLSVATNLASLNTVVGNRGLLLDGGDPMDPEWQDSAVDRVIDLMRDHERKEQLIQANYQWSLGFTWEGQAQVLNRYLLG